ncbi:DNA methyltransferase [Sediminibacterium sp. C3]|uniref:DNA methyltransferase n=1 Tax=Sediminibacterium sp. C3 TaxID=1267211 RepID=UPI000425B8F8|nr:DNA methyltransferase [Sediminibacterium sp. C3]
MDYKKDLAERLPELKKMDSFPIGNDEDIISLSQPPFYTACPNPYLTELLEPNISADDNYHCEPYIGDVSEGKTDPVYLAHTYHTKVPYKAIIHYIEHYTKEGDFVLDAFSGSGMTGVAAKVTNRNCILSDLSPVASLMGASITGRPDSVRYKAEFIKLLSQVKDEFNWLYETNHKENIKGEINYIIYSEILACPYCKTEYSFWDEAFIESDKILQSKFNCPSCKAVISKADSESVIEDYFDEFIQSNSQRLKYRPVLINYKVDKKVFEKKPDETDLLLFRRIEEYKIPYWLPSYQYMFKDGKWGDMWRAGVHFGITHTHHFFTKGSLIVLSRLLSLANNSNMKHLMLYTITSFLTKTGSKLHNIGFKDGKINLAGAQPNSLYIPSLFAERNLFTLSLGKSRDIEKALESIYDSNKSKVFVQVSSATQLLIPNNSIDYVFTDPPFGENLMYSEMNFIWESWLKVFTNNQKEAIINNSQNKDIDSYFDLMHDSFKEYYRVLKPNRWITVVFHNSKSSIWNVLQNALSRAGFIISQVSILDKQQGTKNQQTAAGAVEKDLVISAFKPRAVFEQKLLKNGGLNLEYDFISELLSNQPIKPVLERTEKMLYSKMIAFYIQRGYEVKYDAKTFYALLKTSFIEEDGLWFTSNQINSFLEYKKKMKLDGITELKTGSMFLFISDEKSSLIWLYSFLDSPKTLSEIHSSFTELANFQSDKVPELKEMLNQNFIYENEKYRRPKSEPEHNLITEKREKALQREFEALLIIAKTEKAKIKLVRMEALSYGFELCYKTKRFEDILSLAKKLDKTILENSPELSDFVDAAEIMVQGIS